MFKPALCAATCGLYGHAAVSSRRAGPAAAGPGSDRKPWLRYAIAAASIIAMVPFTWLVMAPTNNTLLELEPSGSAVTELGFVRGLLVRWAWLHAVRSLSPLLGAVLGFTGLVQELGACMG